MHKDFLYVRNNLLNSKMDSSVGLYHIIADDIPRTSITDKCIVLDIDQTLVATQDSTESLKTLNIFSDPKLLPLRNRTYYITLDDLEKFGIGTSYDFWGVTRPHLQEFLVFCFSYFKIVAIWSAGKRPYVEAVVDHIFKDLPQPHIIFTYDDIEKDPNGYIFKPLTKMINSHPILSKFMTPKNTFVVDDNSSTFVDNQGNGILIPEYNPAVTIPSLSRDDPTLLQLKYWLLQTDVVKSRDVTTINKSNIFNQSMDFYKNKVHHNMGYTFQ